MTNGNEFKLGSNKANSIDLNKLKSGVKRADFEADAKMLQVFDAVDSNGNQTLDMNEVTVFTDKMRESAGDDNVLSQKEAKQVFKEQQEREQAANANSKKYDIKAKDLFGFVNKFLDVSEKSKVKSSVVDENGTQTLTFENGAQEIINKDGSKILVNVIDGRKVTKNVDKDGNVVSDEILNEETGDVETLTYDKQGKVKEHIAKNGNVTTYLGVKEGFAQDKPIKQIINAGTSEQETIEYDYSGENSYTSTAVRGDVKNVTVVENGETQTSTATQYKNGKKVQTMSLTKDGVKTHAMYDENEKVRYESVTDAKGKTTEKTFNENGRGLQSVITNPDGKVQVAKYDGKGNTLIVVQNGETFQEICKEFDRTKAELAHTNKGTVHYKNGEPYFLAGETAKVSGEFAPDHKGVRGRKSSAQVKGQYANDEQQRVAKRLQGKEAKEVTVGKNYTDWTHYAKDMLASEGISKPSNEQITNRTNELMMMNPSIQVPKKGNKITALKTQAELKQEAEIKKQREEVQKAHREELEHVAQTSKAKVQANNAKKQATAQGKAISKHLYDEMYSAKLNSVGQESFQKELKKITPNNVVETLREYQKLSPDESMIEAIWDEKSSKSFFSKTDVRKTSIDGIIGKLTQRAKNAGVDKSRISSFGKEMSKYSDYKEEAGRVMYGMIQAIEARETLSKDEIKKAEGQTTEEKIGATSALLRSQISSAKSSLQAQQDKDGWAGKTVDWVSGVWNSKNRAHVVKADIDKSEQQVKDLMSSKDMKTFNAKFKATYGVDFDPVQVAGYKKQLGQYEKSTAMHAMETNFNGQMQKLMSKPKLDVETQYIANPNAGGQVVVTATKEQVYNRELGKFAKFIGMGNSKVGMKQINDEMKKAGIDPHKASMDKKYEFLHNRAKSCSKLLHNQTMQATHGKSYSQVKADFENSYTATFGSKNNIAKRVADYNASQETGAYVLKSGVKIAGGIVIGVATGGVGVAPLLAAAGAQTALSFAVDASDLATSKKGGTVEQYVDAGKQAVVQGASQALSGVSTMAIKATTLSTTSKVLLSTAADTGIDMGTEYINTGKVTLEGTLMSAFMNGAGHTIGAVVENRAKNKPLEIDESKLADKNSGWLGSPTDEHHRYATQLSADEAGNAPTRRTYVGKGIEAQSGDVKGVRYDVKMSQHNESIADIENLLGKGSSKTQFGDGLVKLEDRFRANGSRTLDQRQFEWRDDTGHGVYNAAAAVDEVGGTIGKADGVSIYGSLANNKKAVEMGLDKRLDIVQDAGSLSAKAYSDKSVDMNGWKQQTQASANNGFHAKALEKDGVVMVVFRGSDDMGDLRVDHQMLSGKLPDQFQNAVDFMEQVRANNPNKKIVVTGHSLGGALTELVASKYDDVLGISFDAVGTKGLVTSKTGIAKGLKDNANTINYVVSGDVISNATPHVGQTTLVDVVADASKGNKVQSPHAIGNFSGSASNNSLSGVEKGFVQRSIDAQMQARASLASKGLTLDSAIAKSTTGKVEFDDKAFRKVQSQFSVDVQGLNVDLDAMQKQINAVSNPAQKASLQKILDARKTDITTNANIRARSTVLQHLTGEQINETLKNDFGWSQPAFLGGNTPSELIQMDKPTKFVRVHNDDSSFAKGAWLMAYDDIVGLTPEQIKDKFALPAMPKYVVEVEVPAGAQFYTGLCNPLEGWGNGGGTQYFLVGGERPKVYGNMKPIEVPKKKPRFEEAMGFEVIK